MDFTKQVVFLLFIIVCVSILCCYNQEGLLELYVRVVFQAI